MADHCSYADAIPISHRIIILRLPPGAVEQSSGSQAEETNVDTADPSNSNAQLLACPACDKVFNWKTQLIEHISKVHCQNAARKSRGSGFRTTSREQLGANMGQECEDGQLRPIGSGREMQAEIQEWPSNDHYRKMLNYWAVYRVCVICGKNKRNHPNLSFHAYPSDQSIALKWHNAVGKWLKRNDTICINHFRHDVVILKGKEQSKFVPEPNFDRSLEPQSTGNLAIQERQWMDHRHRKVAAQKACHQNYWAKHRECMICSKKD